MSAVWSLRDVSFRHPGSTRDVVRDVTLDIASGGITAVIGPNGAGKSTLLRLLLGTIAPVKGSIAFRDRALATWERREIAREIGVVPQGEADPLFNVREIVGMGRYPHLGPWQRERDVDVAAINRAMDRCDVTAFADRWLTTLSGGERQRVRVARALAQEARVLVLDEPTTFLDIKHEMATFTLLRDLRADGMTVVIATHNLNLASRFADSLALMREGQIIAYGARREVLTQERLSSVYEWPVTVVHDASGAPQIVPGERALR